MNNVVQIVGIALSDTPAVCSFGPLHWTAAEKSRLAERAGREIDERNIKVSRESAVAAISDWLLDVQRGRAHMLETTTHGNRIWRERDPEGYRRYAKARAQHKQMIRQAKRLGASAHWHA